MRELCITYFAVLILAMIAHFALALWRQCLSCAFVYGVAAALFTLVVYRTYYA